MAIKVLCMEVNGDGGRLVIMKRLIKYKMKLIPLKQTRIHVGILYQHGIQKTFLIWHYHLVIHFFSFMFIMENYHVNFIREVRIYFCVYHSILLVMDC